MQSSSDRLQLKSLGWLANPSDIDTSTGMSGIPLITSQSHRGCQKERLTLLLEALLNQQL